MLLEPSPYKAFNIEFILCFEFIRCTTSIVYGVILDNVIIFVFLRRQGRLKWWFEMVSIDFPFVTSPGQCARRVFQ